VIYNNCILTFHYKLKTVFFINIINIQIYKKLLLEKAKRSPQVLAQMTKMLKLLD